VRKPKGRLGLETVIYLNIGNTNTQVLSNNQLETIATSMIVDCVLLKRLLRVPNAQVIFMVASVVPSANLALQKAFPLARFNFVTWEMLSWINFKAVDPTTIGADRLCNLAAVSMLKLPAMVIDFGTAITTEVLGADLQFLGGNILPGRQLSRLALEQHTAQLPKTALTLVEPFVVGMNTVESIQTIDSFAIGGILYLIDRARKLFTSQLSIYATGGDAPYFLKHIPELTETPSDFTLQGLKEIQKRSI